MRIVSKILAATASGLALLALAGFLFLRRSLPELAGTRTVEGLVGKVEIVRDAHAVPHIYAERELGAYFALGYVHAQDRLWQMDLARRMGSGRLAELFGGRVLEQDRLFRTLGLRRAAANDLRALDAESQEIARAYARGVNAWLAEEHPLPPEFSLFRAEMEPWDPVDSLVFVKVMAWALAGNSKQELWRMRMAHALSPERAEQLEPPYPGEGSLELAELWKRYAGLGVDFGESGKGAGGERHGAFAIDDTARALGSNNWVVDGTRTESGKPLLANDPHMRLSAPSQWYLAHLNAPGMNVIGATLPALPGVVLGRNDAVAWSFTNTLSDTQDLYLERLTADGKYLTPEGPRAFEAVRETIHVKGSDDVELLVRSTRHGPVVSDATEDLRDVTPSGYALALSWTALAPGDRTLSFARRASKAKDAGELRLATEALHSPQQNVVYADVFGHVGFVAAGRAPRRRASDAFKGRMPAPGWLSDYDWDGFVPFEELPALFDPSSGRIVTANQKITPEGYPHWLGADWGLPYRAERILELLDRKPKHTLESFKEIQLDVQSGFAERLLDVMLSTLPRELPSRERELAVQMKAWDRKMRADGMEPLLFAVWVRELSRLLYEDELGALFPDNWLLRPEFLAHVLSDQGGQAKWCDDVRSLERESCPWITERALARALDYLVERFGDDPSAWRWGTAHPARAKHLPLGELPLVSYSANVVTAAGGDGSSINLSGYSMKDEDPFIGGGGPGFRALYDLSDLERSLAILNTGQSGHLLSPHYRDMNPLWARGEYVPLVTRRARIEGGALGTLVLRPR